LLTHVPVPASQVFAVPTVGHTAAEAAAEYTDALRRFFAAEAGDVPPCFDLILLGMGDDGHTVSLFPGSEALRVDDAWVAWSPPGTLPPPVDRVTMTYPVLNAARHVAFLVAGQSKAPALRDVIEGRASCDVRPAAGIRPTYGTVTWLIDDDAASLLSERPCTMLDDRL
jgi:6-phosphogluconolactonase